MAPLRHLTSINDLTNTEVEQVFALARRYLKELGDPAHPARVAKSIQRGKGRILATLFYEPSTRTRLSFESAMLRLGGKTMSSADAASSSAAKGESIADSVRMVSNYADVIVIRHPRDGAARQAADYAHVPVINGGDGSHEHPTQTLGDLFTLRQGRKSLKGMNVALFGDLMNGRTVHSLVYALARFEANVVPMQAPGMGLPEHVAWRLANEFKHGPVRNVSAYDRIDALYVTRFQKERASNEGRDYPRIDPKFLEDRKYAKTRLLHPLPRVDELDVALDRDVRAAHFTQAAYAVPVRMALLSLILGIDGKLKRFADGFPKTDADLYDQAGEVGMRCANPKCIVHDPAERKFTRNKFYLMPFAAPRLRCYYCETDIEHFIAASHGGDTVYFATAADAEAQGFAPKKKVATK